jgi:hypothetical protein
VTSNDDLFARSDPWVQRITLKRIGAAMEGFALPFAPEWNLERLTFAIQGIAQVGRGKPPQGDADAIKELLGLAERARQLRADLGRMGETAELAVFWEVWRSLDAVQKDGHLDQERDVHPLILHPLETIANVLSRAASQMASQRKQTSRWRDKYAQDRRVAFAIHLAPIFSEAFDTPARATNWGQDFGKEHPWPDFFRRIHMELFPETRRLNLAEVLQEALRQAPKVEAMRRWLDEQDAIRAQDK